MRAQLAAGYTSLYKTIRGMGYENGSDLHLLYLLIYPKIMGAVRMGESKIILTRRLSKGCIDHLVRSGYLIMIDDESCTISWLDPVLPERPVKLPGPINQATLSLDS